VPIPWINLTTETKGWEKAQNLSMLLELLQEKLNSNLSDGQE